MSTTQRPKTRKIGYGHYEADGGWTIISPETGGFNLLKDGELLEWFPHKRQCIDYIMSSDTPCEPAPAQPHEYTIANMMTGTHSFEVHARGCQGLARSIKQRKTNNEWDVTAASAAEAVQFEVEEFEAQDQGWTSSDFKVHSCTRKAG